MATAQDAMERALRLLTVIDPDENIEARPSESLIFAFNSMMARWEADGASVGWVAIVTPSDTLHVPDANLDGVIANLAVTIAPEYKATVTPEVGRMAVEGYQAALRDALLLQPTDMSFLPSNYGRWDINSDG